MALKFTDKLKGIDLGKAVDVASSITNSISHTIDRVKLPTGNGGDESVIDSVDSLGCYLQSLQPEASPAVMMALQSQLQVLKYVQSPTMTLMAVDNIMVCLHKALKLAEDESKKEALKETFTSLLQSFIFATEARLRYEIDSNREESIRLLADAGDMLMSSVTMTATMAVPMAAGVKMGHAIPKMVNVLASNTEQKSFLGRLIMAKGRKAIIEEKKQEFDKTLNYIFETLDSYSELVGPSIQLHGMLKRYADGLIERYSHTQYEDVANRINTRDTGKLESFMETTAVALSAKNEVEGFKMLFKAVAQTTKTTPTFDYNSVRNLKRTLQSELKECDNYIEKLNGEISAAEDEIGQLSMLKFSRKNELQAIVKQCCHQKSILENKRLECQNKINTVSDIVDPVDERVNQYSTNLYRIVEKYRYTI